MQQNNVPSLKHRPPSGGGAQQQQESHKLEGLAPVTGEEMVTLCAGLAFNEDTGRSGMKRTYHRIARAPPNDDEFRHGGRCGSVC